VVGVHAWSDGSRMKAANVNVADSDKRKCNVNFYLEMGGARGALLVSHCFDAAPADRVYFYHRRKRMIIQACHKQ